VKERIKIMEGEMQGYMTVKDLAKMLSKKESTIRRWCRIRLDKMPFYYVGGSYLFKYVEIEEWLKKQHSSRAQR